MVLNTLTLEMELQFFSNGFVTEKAWVGLSASDISKSAYLAPDIPPGLFGEHPAAVQTGRRAIYQEALGS